MVTTDDVFEILTATSAELKNHWDAYLKSEYPDEKNSERLIYLDISEIRRFIEAKFIKGETEFFGFFFESVERILIEGDAEAINLIGVGLLEGLQNSSIGLRNEEFNHWLKPETKSYWDTLIFHFRTGKLKQKWIKLLSVIKKGIS